MNQKDNVEEMEIQEKSRPPGNTGSRPPYDDDLLTISDLERGFTNEATEEVKWNYLAGAAHRNELLTGIVSSMEQLAGKDWVAVIDYQGLRVLIPVKEMVLEEIQDDVNLPQDIEIRMGRMLGATVDFVPVAVNVRDRAAVGSRKAALRRLQERYYASGRVKPGIRIACRVVRVGNHNLTVEAAGVESNIAARDVAYEWYSDLHEKFAIGDLVIARVKGVARNEETGYYSVQLSIRDAEENPGYAVLEQIRVDTNYFGKVTGVKNGTIFVRLQIGCNAKTRLFRSRQMPGKNDLVSFKVTWIDEFHCEAQGFITRIIKRQSELRR